MNEFEPSRDFVASVMKDVRAYEEEEKPEEPLGESLFFSGALRFAFSAGAMLVGVFNLVRLYFSLFSPVGCR